MSLLAGDTATHPPSAPRRRCWTTRPAQLPRCPWPTCHATFAAIEHSQRRVVINAPFRVATVAHAQPGQANQGSISESDEEDTGPVSPHGNNSGLTATELESLEVLEWPAVSRQVARLCGTVMGAQRLAAGGVPLGTSLQHSQLLQQQTQEAVDMQLSVQGVFDLNPALSAVEAGACLNAKQFEGVATALQAALQIKQQVEAGAGEGPGAKGSRYPALAQLASGIEAEEASTLAAIRHCIRLGGVSDAASETLATVRAERQANSTALRTLMNETMRMLFEKGASDSKTYNLVRDRYCAGVKAGRQSDLPKGSVKLSASQTGATMYYEPAPAIPLNNRAALLAGKEAEEEAKVLTLLSQLLASRAEAVRQLLEAVTQLDMVSARAKHARTFGASPPRLVPAHAPVLGHTSSTRMPHAPAGHASTSSGQVSSSGSGRGSSQLHSGGSQAGTASLMHVMRAHHPLLLERVLAEPLPEPPSIDDNRFDRNFGSAPAWELKRSALGRPPTPPAGGSPAAATAATLAGTAAGGAAAAGGGSSAATASSGGAGGAESVMETGTGAGSGFAPKALDLMVPEGRQVVAITGPNTGGKTVTLKTMGLVALMARAGMWVTVDRQGHGTDNGDTRPVVGWFGRVLADIGDAQSLQQNLSTFSGHIRRIKQVLATADGSSLVLLDEVGSGTDPVEGAALARAILDKLAGTAALTVATTHHAELKQVATEDARYTNVSMEFDTASLRPTYRLLWGAVGASNALDIARTLGFDSSVVNDAVIIARTTFEAQEDRSARLAATANSLVKQLQDTKEELVESRVRREEVEGQLEAIRSHINELDETNTQLMSTPRLIVKRRDRIKANLDAAIAAYETGRGTREQVDAILRDLEEQVADKIAQHNNQPVMAVGQVVSKGDKVVVPSRFGEDMFTVAVVAGGVATLTPEGSLGAGLQLLAMGRSGNRRKGASLKVPVADIRVVSRREEGAGVS